MLLFSVAAGAQFVNVGRANPYFDGGMVPPDPSAKPPGISIFAPQNNTVYTTNTIPFSINVTLPESQKADGTSIHVIYYETDWQQNRTLLFDSGAANFDDQILSSSTYFRQYFLFSQDLTGIPDGNHTIRVYANGGGSYVEDWYRYSFYMKASSSVCFTIDTVPPEVVLSVENKTYYTTDIPLGFAVNELNTQVTFSLDGQDNVTIAGNTTLTNLPYGEHNVTAYVTDEAGNTGASETIIFNVAKPEPFPTTIVIASIATVAVISMVLLVYFKKRKHQSEMVGSK
jgi:hypothetical protein